MDGDDASGVAAGVLGSFLLGNPRCWLTCAACGSTCVPAGGPAVPSLVRASAVLRGAMRCAVRCWGKGEEEERTETDTRVPHVRERKKKRAPVAGMLG
jgi:hypothetical protein